jgi:glucosamine-6-phosphate deaminase
MTDHASRPPLPWEELVAVPAEQLAERGRVPLRIFPDAGAMFAALARAIADLIKARSAAGEPTRLIFPVGPKKHYPLLAEICNRERISWRDCHCWNMDEWLDWECRPLPLDHPFSLEGYMRRSLYEQLDPDLRPPEAQLCFPSPRNFLELSDRLAALGGADLCIAGFGFSGHIAFNEPPASRWYRIPAETFRGSRARILPINDETFIAIAHRAAGGNTRAIPPMAVTLGMRDLLGARRMILVSDGGAWKQTILRVMLLHEPTVEYPCTFVQGHPDACVWVDPATAAAPDADIGEARRRPQ